MESYLGLSRFQSFVPPMEKYSGKLDRYLDWRLVIHLNDRNTGTQRHREARTKTLLWRLGNMVLDYSSLSFRTDIYGILYRELIYLFYFWTLLKCAFRSSFLQDYALCFIVWSCFASEGT